jgi:2-polyprenyl-6-methoxyphenol hydroxylase-like FAD-dependent oxidoreductase
VTVTDIVIMGGSVAGLASAVALADATRRVTILEQDSPAPPPSPGVAFSDWERRGVAQERQSHAFLARLHRLLAERAPELLASLFANGAEPMRFPEFARAILPDAEFVPEDDEITLIACRRLTFEWVLRQHVEALPGVAFERGVQVTGLQLEPAGASPPRVRGVCVQDRSGSARTHAADLVVDAMGRRSRVSRWLREAGARPVREDSEPCGIFYSSRFYRVAAGAEMPRLDGPMGADLGYLKYGIFPGDDRTFSITLAASPDDAPFRALFRAPAFDALAATLPATKPWVDPEVATPISRVMPMANLKNTRRFFVDETGPVALGIAAVGDALIHTNPIVGRGCTLAFVNAFLLADALAAHPEDAKDFALDLDARVAEQIVPWYEGLRMQDRDAIRVNAMLRRGEDPYRVNRADGTVDPNAYMRSVLRDGLLPALREDVTVLRAFMRIFNLLDAPNDLMKDPAMLGRILAVYQRRHEDSPEVLGPTRAEVVAQLESLAA